MTTASRQSILIALLALTTLAGGVIAWRQYQELAALRATTTDGNAALRQRLAAAEARARELEDRLAARETTATATRDAESDGAAAEVRPGRGGFTGRGGRGGPGADFRAVMDSPLGQKVQQQQQQLALDSRYAALFKTLNLPAEKLASFKALLLEKQSVIQDVMSAARDQGVDPRTGGENIRQMIASSQAEIDGNIKSLLGDDAFGQYNQFQSTQPQRALVNQLQQSLSYTAAPLTTAQAEQLVSILAANPAPATNRGANGDAFPAPAPDGGPRGGFAFAGGPGGVVFGGGTTITSQAVSAAQQILSEPQLTALQQLQQAQEAQQQLNQQMRANRGNTAPRGGG